MASALLLSRNVHGGLRHAFCSLLLLEMHTGTMICPPLPSLLKLRPQYATLLCSARSTYVNYQCPWSLKVESRVDDVFYSIRKDIGTYLRAACASSTSYIRDVTCLERPEKGGRGMHKAYFRYQKALSSILFCEMHFSEYENARPMRAALSSFKYHKQDLICLLSPRIWFQHNTCPEKRTKYGCSNHICRSSPQRFESVPLHVRSSRPKPITRAVNDCSRGRGVCDLRPTVSSHHIHSTSRDSRKEYHQ